MKMGVLPASKNSPIHQTSARDSINGIIYETIHDKLETKAFSPAGSNTFCLADLGCAVGPGTFYHTHNMLQAVESKFLSQGFSSDQLPQFHVFFNDLPFSDFNTLFKSLPSNRRYFAAGVPGSFHGRLFPDSSLHFVHSSYALHWLSKVPEEALDRTSPAWNKGRIHYTCASEAVLKAFEGQFGQDMEMFLDARAKELLEGSIMVLILRSIPDGVPHLNTPMGILLDRLESCLVDMAKEGLISEALVDSFNIPIYFVTPNEMTRLVEQNGSFRIERMEPTDCKSHPENRPSGYSVMMPFRAGMEGFIARHFGVEIIDELFERFYERMDEVMGSLFSCNGEGSQLTVILKRRSCS